MWGEEQARIWEKQAQIKVVAAMRSEEMRKELSAERDFLVTKSIKPDIPATEQKDRVDKVVK